MKKFIKISQVFVKIAHEVIFKLNIGVRRQPAVQRPELKESVYAIVDNLHTGRGGKVKVLLA